MTMLELCFVIASVIVMGILLLVGERQRARRVAEGKASFPPWLSVAVFAALTLGLGGKVYEVINEGATGREIIRLVLYAVVLFCAFGFLRRKSPRGEPWGFIAVFAVLTLGLGANVYEVINEGATGRETIRLALYVIVLFCAFGFHRWKKRSNELPA